MKAGGLMKAALTLLYVVCTVPVASKGRGRGVRGLGLRGVVELRGLLVEFNQCAYILYYTLALPFCLHYILRNDIEQGSGSRGATAPGPRGTGARRPRWAGRGAREGGGGGRGGSGRSALSGARTARARVCLHIFFLNL